MIEQNNSTEMSAAEYWGLHEWAEESALQLGADPNQDAAPLEGVAAIKAATAVLWLAVADGPETPDSPEKDAALESLSSVILELARVVGPS